MKITIECTEKIVNLNGIPARVWEGTTESGVEVYCFIPRIAIKDTVSQETIDQFQKELTEMRAPSKEVLSFPISMII